MKFLLALALLLIAPPCFAASPIANNAVTVASDNALLGLTGASTTSAGTSQVIKASPANLYSAYATNISAVAGYLIVVNATAAPGTGALTGATVLDCVALPANGSAALSYSPGPPKVYSIGVVALVSSASTCFTYTTGSITAFISGSAP